MTTIEEYCSNGCDHDIDPLAHDILSEDYQEHEYFKCVYNQFRDREILVTTIEGN